MADSLDYQQAVHRLQSCEKTKEVIREELLLGENGKKAVKKLNPNRVTVKYLEPAVVELQRATRQMEEVLEEYGDPGDNLLGDWYWSGADDLKRLRARANFYMQAIEYARANLDDAAQREYLYETVFVPLFFGGRHKDVADLESPWIYTLSDFCEPGRIYKNYVYAVEVNDASTGMGNFLGDIWGTISDYFEWAGDAAERLYRGGEKIVEGVGDVARAVSKHALPIGLVVAGIGIGTYVWSKRKRAA